MAVVVSNARSTTVVVSADRVLQITERRPDTVQVSDRRTTHTATDNARTVVATAPGVQGPRGAEGGTSVTRIAAQALGGHRLVRSIDAQQVDYVSNDNPLHGDDTLGLTLGAAVAGAPIEVQATGQVTFAGWAWTPGEPVFAGRDGLLTQVAPDPDTGAMFSQPVGHAETSTTLLLRLLDSIYFD